MLGELHRNKSLRSQNVLREGCTTLGHYVGGSVQNHPTRSRRATENYPTTWAELHKLCRVGGQSLVNIV
nr:MAG TPA: hypothetical protein [Caudoviricetes sp.]